VISADESGALDCCWIYPAVVLTAVLAGTGLAELAPRDRAHGGLLAPSLVARGPARRGIALHGLTGRGLGAVRGLRPSICGTWSGISIQA
jgi:hypothetical protein